jgi:ribosomal protein S18 acetylase RimI-like enzyme
MNSKVTILEITAENIASQSPSCFMSPTHEGSIMKEEWAKLRFKEGLQIKQLFLEGVKKPIGFIEYIPGEFAWRAVSAKDFMFIHCIWITPNKYKSHGYASMLLDECYKDAKEKQLKGVAVITSEGAFMSSKDLYLKNGFEIIDTAKPSFTLLIKSMEEYEKPSFRNYESQLAKTEGLQLYYSKQCPWVARAVNELGAIAKKNNIILETIELKTAADAQNAPSVYGVFSLVNDGKLLSDHYISATRFQNILNKEVIS